MLEIRVEVEKQKAKEFLKAQDSHCDISDKLTMCAYDGGVLVGVGAVSMTDQEATIEEICCSCELGLAMGKALLNTIDLGGIKHVSCRQPHLYSLAECLGFRKNQNNSSLNLDLNGYFTTKCH